VREEVFFTSGGARCAAWHYPGDSSACVVMAGGFAMTKEPATDLFARRFQEAGFGVLAFDYRGFGHSGGEPRLVAPVRAAREDWRAALAFAGSLPGVDPARVAAWSFSASAGHVLRVAAQGGSRIAAVVAQTPNADGLASARLAGRYQKPGAMLRFMARAVLDAAGSVVGRAPLLVPLVGEPGTVAMLTTPDAREGSAALTAGGRYPDWRQEVAARSALRLVFYRPGRAASRIRCPLLVMVCDEDRSAAPDPAAAAARRAPLGELVRLPGGHYAPFFAAHEQALQAQLSFLQRHLLGADDRSPAPLSSGSAHGAGGGRA
jgi:pimeloyl-ACP methyl ester carboxylesterase